MFQFVSLCLTTNAVIVRGVTCAITDCSVMLVDNVPGNSAHTAPINHRATMEIPVELLYEFANVRIHRHLHH